MAPAKRINMIALDYSKRNPAIDILRALTMVLMVFVNDFWTVKGVPSWMAHAAYDQDMLGLSDIVFPCFLFAVGMSIPYALENAFAKGRSGVQIVGHILKRTLALLIMGVYLVNTEGGVPKELGMSSSIYKILLIASFFLIWNVYPKSEKPSRKRLYIILQIVGVLLLIYLGVIFRDGQGNFLRPKWWGILGLIGWTYLVCAFVYFFTRDKLKYLVPVWAIFLIWSMLRCNLKSTGVPLLNLPQGNALDAFVGILHIDGASCALTMGGALLSVIDMRCRRLTNRKRVVTALALVAALILLALATNRLWIISKLQSTVPWALFCSAISTGVYFLLVWATENGKEKWFDIVRPAGTATLTCYMVPHILYAILILTGIGTMRPAWCASGLPGLLTCLIFSLACVGFTWCLGKLHIKLKV